ncbi:hypothetical protein [Actinoallomurus rhizosphaericola]|uniref:hypothetical protein n=1 Tax=Actinoallomurus rhizosphaericola TaxID=2952536 RepID=UPI0020932E05|nr:hypothetical protein [Actinoallomurus rhizosphaericola]MCO5999871.1 hypothetical protein [Actinoallomurus rhizosphaericola]
MEDTHDPSRPAARRGGRRRTALVAVPGLAVAGLAATVLAGGPAHARTPQPPRPAPQQHGGPAHPGHTAQPSPSPSQSPSRSAQPTRSPSQTARPSQEGSRHSREAGNEHRAKGAELHLVFDRPEAAGDSGVLWRWTLVNEGAGAADDVVATQKVTSGHKILGLSKPCAPDHETVVCRYDTIGAGDRRAGWIKTSGSLKGGPLRVDAKMTWRDRPTAADTGTEGNHHPGH